MTQVGITAHLVPCVFNKREPAVTPALICNKTLQISLISLESLWTCKCHTFLFDVKSTKTSRISCNSHQKLSHIDHFTWQLVFLHLYYEQTWATYANLWCERKTYEILCLTFISWTVMVACSGGFILKVTIFIFENDQTRN